MTRVLLVEDERAIAESLEFALRRDGFDVSVAGTLKEAEPLVPDCDLVVLDLMLPDGSGFDLVGKLRAADRRVAVIILTSRDEEADRVAGLEGGADDYVIKPFSPREVVARIRAVLRRVQPQRRSHTTPADAPEGLSIDAETRRSAYQGTALDLTRTEFDLLYALSSAPGRVFTRQQLIDRIFGEGHAVTDRTIDAHVKALRKKLLGAGADPDLVETERGVGYRLRDRSKAFSHGYLTSWKESHGRGSRNR